MALRKPITTYALLSVVNGTAATGVTGAVVLRDFDYSSLTFALTCTSGATTAITLDVWVQTSADGGTTWFDMLRFPRVTTTGQTSWGVAALGGNSMIGVVGSSTISNTSGATGVPLLSNTLQVLYNLNGSNPTASFNLNALITDSSRGAE